MKLRDKTNKEICDENKIPFAVLTNIVEEKNAKNRMRATSNLIAKALIATLGPYGTNTIIQDRELKHFATKDGYDLLNRMTFQDEVARTILDLFRATASNQVLSVGDGSTSAIVVANSLFQMLTDPVNNEKFKKIAPKDIIDILNDIATILEDKLKKMAKPISEDMHELDIIAAVANNNDYQAGKTIADIYKKIGVNGFISMDVVDRVEKDTFEIKAGVDWDRGFIDPFFEKFAENGKIKYENPKVFLTSSFLTYDDLQTKIMPVFKAAFNQEGQQLLVVCNGCDEDVIQFFKNNRTKHLSISGPKSVEMDFVVVDIDQVSAESRNKLEDLAILCGCKVYDKLFINDAEFTLHMEDYIGRADSAIISKKESQVLAGENLDEKKKKTLSDIIKEFNKKIVKLDALEMPTKEEFKELYELKKRVSRLTSSSALLHIGGKTLTERMTRQRLIEDAVLACKSALKFGYIPGGNICIPKILLSEEEGIADFLGTKYSYLPIESIRLFFLDFIRLLADAFLESYRAVLNNSYMSEEDTEKTVKECLENNKFYNLKLHKFEKWNETNIINSVDTDIQILRSTISIIAILSTANQFLTINFDANACFKDIDN